jgi:hypothetical protein
MEAHGREIKLRQENEIIKSRECGRWVVGGEERGENGG